MTIASLFDKLAGRQRQREQSRADDYLGLVQAIAAGKEVDADRVDAVLAAGKSVDELKAAVELRMKRLLMRALLDAVPGLEKEQAGTLAQIDKAKDAIERVKAKHREAVRPLYNRLEEIAAAIREGQISHGRLFDTCSKEVRARLDAANRDLMAATTRAMKLRSDAATLRSWAEGDRERATRTDRPEELIERAKQREAGAAELERELVGVEKDVVALKARVAEVEAEVLVP